MCALWWSSSQRRPHRFKPKRIRRTVKRVRHPAGEYMGYEYRPCEDPKGRYQTNYISNRGFERRGSALITLDAADFVVRFLQEDHPCGLLLVVDGINSQVELESKKRSKSRRKSSCSVDVLLYWIILHAVS